MRKKWFRQLQFRKANIHLVPGQLYLLDVLKQYNTKLSAIRQKGEFQNRHYNKKMHAKNFKKLVFFTLLFFRKIRRALFSCNNHFEIRPFALLPTILLWEKFQLITDHKNFTVSLLVKNDSLFSCVSYQTLTLSYKRMKNGQTYFRNFAMWIFAWFM